MNYTLHAMHRRMMEPLNLAAEAGQMMLQPVAAFYPPARFAQASLEMVGRVTRTYAKPDFGLDVEPEVVDDKPFCRLLRFRNRHGRRNAKTLLVVAPLSGHHATLLRDTVDALIDIHDLEALSDERQFFPIYNPAPLVRAEVLETDEEVLEELGRLAPTFGDVSEMRRLVRQVDIGKRHPRVVAREYLEATDLI